MNENNMWPEEDWLQPCLEISFQISRNVGIGKLVKASDNTRLMSDDARKLEDDRIRPNVRGCALVAEIYRTQCDLTWEMLITLMKYRGRFYAGGLAVATLATGYGTEIREMIGSLVRDYSASRNIIIPISMKSRDDRRLVEGKYWQICPYTKFCLSSSTINLVRLGECPSKSFIAMFRQQGPQWMFGS